MEAINTVEMQAETLSGDVRDHFLDLVRLSDLGWTKLSERDQNRFIGNVEKLARDTVRQVVDTVAHAGFRHVVIAVQDVSLGDALKIKATAAFTVEDVTKLASHGRGKPAVLVLADPTAFFGERASATADKDQPDLPIHDGDGVIDGETVLDLKELHTNQGESNDEGEGEAEETEEVAETATPLRRRRRTTKADAPEAPEMPADPTREAVDA